MGVVRPGLGAAFSSAFEAAAGLDVLGLACWVNSLSGSCNGGFRYAAESCLCDAGRTIVREQVAGCRCLVKDDDEVDGVRDVMDVAWRTVRFADSIKILTATPPVNYYCDAPGSEYERACTAAGGNVTKVSCGDFADNEIDPSKCAAYTKCGIANKYQSDSMCMDICCSGSSSDATIPPYTKTIKFGGGTFLAVGDITHFVDDPNFLDEEVCAFCPKHLLLHSILLICHSSVLRLG